MKGSKIDAAAIPQIYKPNPYAGLKDGRSSKFTVAEWNDEFKLYRKLIIEIFEADGTSVGADKSGEYFIPEMIYMNPAEVLDICDRISNNDIYDDAGNYVCKTHEMFSYTLDIFLRDDATTAALTEYLFNKHKDELKDHLKDTGWKEVHDATISNAKKLKRQAELHDPEVDNGPLSMITKLLGKVPNSTSIRKKLENDDSEFAEKARATLAKLDAGHEPSVEMCADCPALEDCDHAVRAEDEDEEDVDAIIDRELAKAEKVKEDLIKQVKGNKLN